MSYTTLISATELLPNLSDPNWAIIDCRFALADPERGRRDYVQAHIPGAIYAHLNEDLSGPIVPGITGRHPLPAIDELTARFSGWGIDESVQVVAYDDSGGGIAARLWWLLRWLGHDAVAVLNGDWRKWKSEGHPVRDGVAVRASRRFVPHPRSDLLLSTDDVESRLADAGYKLFDSRTADRYRGENETIDPIAGHIPGAISAPYPDNLYPDGTFQSDEELRARFTVLLGNTPVEQTAFYCGSGVTAAQNILALRHVGLGDAKLYAGSWSEWITNPQRPIEK
ncbi:MAG TPA: sulfurtransferase [Anaerolineae bacterium]|nr:sulfurtransferase [Anaerolineae bacterium]